MSPPVAVIVGTVIISVGAAVIITKHVWPHVQPHVQPQAEEFWRRIVTAHQRHRSREGAYWAFPDDDSHDNSGEAYSTGNKYREASTGGNLRQRPSTAPGHSIMDEKLPEVEMIHLADKPATFPVMSVTPSRSSHSASRGLPTFVDDNPFMEQPIEVAVPVAIAIPLPQSPESSILGDSSTLGRSAGKIAKASFSNSMTNSLPSAAPPTVAPTLAQAFVHPLSPASGRGSGARHRASRSMSSSASGNALAPPQIGSPVARPMSSSGISDTASLVSATPSRDWTEGGTADIFSGSEKDFHEQDSDVEDLKSISDSGSWEDVRNAGTSSSEHRLG